MKFAFLDAEFTGEHQATTLVSLGIVGEGNESLSIVFNDYDRDQVTPWLQENVLTPLAGAKAVNRREGFEQVRRWFDEYSGGQPVGTVTVGKTLDLVLLFQLWHQAFPDRKYFHNLYCLPDYLNHSTHLDLPTVFWLAGLPPDTDREKFIGHSLSGRRHDALYDAQVVKECFRRCVTRENFPKRFP